MGIPEQGGSRRRWPHSVRHDTQAGHGLPPPTRGAEV